MRFVVGKFLLKVADASGFDDFSGVFAVSLHKRRVINHFKQGGFAVAFLADNGRPVVLFQREGKIRDKMTQVFPVADGQISDLKRRPQLLCVMMLKL